MYSQRTSLPAIVTLARAGSLDLAERLFAQAGYADRSADPAALAVLGRLRKDRAARLPPGERAGGYARAADAYAAADRIAPAPYTRLNVATLSYLAGDRARARAIAQGIVAWLDSGAEIADTPYHLAATRAEALLLCGDVGGAANALARGVAAQPEAWQDHATTLRQFAAICAAGDLDARFLDPLRPPRSLHYAGHLGIAPMGHEALSGAIASYLHEQRVAFGYGALAAGADLVIAEQLVAIGAELHVFLPGSVDEFARQSVEPYGADWRTRFDACLAAACEVRCFAQPQGRFQPLGNRIAADVAMGAALMNARRLESAAVQLLIADAGAGEYGSGLETARTGRLWRSRGGEQRVLHAPRIAQVAASGTLDAPEGDPDLRLATLLRIEFDGIDQLDEAAFAVAVHAQVQPLHARAAALSIQPDLTLPAGNAQIVAFADPAQAWRYAHGLLALPAQGLSVAKLANGESPVEDPSAQERPAGRMPLKIAGHLGLVHWLGDPPTLVGRALADLDCIAMGAVPGALTVSETLAHVLQLTPEGAPHVEHVGEVGGIALYAVTASS